VGLGKRGAVRRAGDHVLSHLMVGLLEGAGVGLD
jgi:hypothetical protein